MTCSSKSVTETFDALEEGGVTSVGVCGVCADMVSKTVLPDHWEEGPHITICPGCAESHFRKAGML